MDLLKLTALELGKKIKVGEVTVREAVRADSVDNPRISMQTQIFIVKYIFRTISGHDPISKSRFFFINLFC